MKIFTAFILFLTIAIQAQTHTVPAEWGPEVLIPTFDSTKSQKGVLYNNMVVASTGRIIIATVEVNISNNIPSGTYLTYSDDNGATWLTPPVKINSMSLAIGGSSPKLAIDNNDNLFVVWTAKSPAAIFCTKMTSNLSVIFDTVRVANKILYGNFTPHLTIDKQNRLHVMWHEGDMDAGNIAEAYHCRSTDGGNSFSIPQLISSNDGRHSAFPHAQFHHATGDTLAIGWRDSVSASQKWDVYIVTSTNGGASWNPPLPIVAGTDYDSDPDVVVDPFNRIHIVFHKYPNSDPFFGAQIRYGYSDNLGLTWNPIGFATLSETNKRSHLTEGNEYDSLRNIFWAVWKDERDFSGGNARADIVVAYSTDRGNSWSSPEFATDWDTLTLGFKAGTLLANGDLALNYEVFNASGNLNRVYFRKRTTLPTNADEATILPEQFILFQNYPNPFNPSTIIKYAIGSRQYVTLKIIDILGREVATLVNEMKEAGVYSSEFSPDASGLNSPSANQFPSGVYFYQLRVGSPSAGTRQVFVETKKMILLR